MKFNCIICNSEFKRFGKQTLTAKCCSSKCLGEYNKAKPNTKCTNCNKEFHIKQSQKNRYKRKQGYFCSITCLAEYRKICYLGEENPNFRKQVTRDDGYKLIYLPTIGRIKLHHFITFNILGINKIPKGYCIHHRDCNVDNNEPENLVLLTNSDHRWLHKQFGNATLWAYMNNLVSLEELSKWTNNIEETNRLLPLSILGQIGIFKQGELLETPTILNGDNQQPSLSSNTLEGSTTNSRILAGNTEDSNADTSALPFK